MIGELRMSGKPVVRMEDDGSYTAVGGEWEGLAEWLNDYFDPVGNRLAGDSATPFGVSALYRAGKVFPPFTVVLAKPVPDLPAGTIN
jgi:hypothetical protein